MYKTNEAQKRSEIQKISETTTYPDEPSLSDDPNIDEIVVLGDGLWYVGANALSLHFILVTKSLDATIPHYMRKPDGLYDTVEWCIPAVVLADHITHKKLKESIQKGVALNTLRHYFPDSYEKFTGISVKPGESEIRDPEIFEEKPIEIAVGMLARTDEPQTLLDVLFDWVTYNPEEFG